MKSQLVVPILSGGMDSTTMVYWLLATGHEIPLVLSFDYNQRHSRELDCAEKTCRRLGLTHRVASIQIPPGGSSLLDHKVPVPEGHYEAESMKATVVPNRNMLMLAHAVAYAQSVGASAVAYGAHSGDHAIYSDCRKVFFESLDVSIQLATDHQICLLAPFIDYTKADIVKVGTGQYIPVLDVPYEDTWSCYKGGGAQCGKCGTCVERLEAFELAGVKDPVPYEP